MGAFEGAYCMHTRVRPFTYLCIETLVGDIAVLYTAL